MIIGIDFDNTVVDYDLLFYNLALEKSLIPKDLLPTKNGVRDYLRKAGKELLWTEMQGEAYGSRIVGASPFPGVLEFLKKCRDQNITVYIISHKTLYPFLGKKHNLHEAAQLWLEKHSFYNLEKTNLTKEKVFLELTKEDKMKRIAEFGCTVFIDDLSEFLLEKDFPKTVKRILFKPQQNYKVHLNSENSESHNNSKLEVVSSWKEIGSKLLNIQDNVSDDLLLEVQKLLAEKNIPEPFTITSEKGGRNSKIYCICTKRGKFCLKLYFQHEMDKRLRMENEFLFSIFAWNVGIRSIPQPYYKNEEKQLAIYDYIEGIKIASKNITLKIIDQAGRFFIDLNKYKNNEEAQKIPLASEACLSLKDHISCVENRLVRLSNIVVNDEIDQNAVAFIKNKLKPGWEKIKQKVEEDIVKNKWNFEEALPITERCLSPSDFGFHNALLSNEGKIYFLDFEYAGWDDPAKLICDFFCQPQIPIPLDYFDYFSEKAASVAPDPKKVKSRAKIFLPAHRIKWCCIMLNEFLEEVSQRRCFSMEIDDYKKYKAQQLQKSEKYFQEFSELSNGNKKESKGIVSDNNQNGKI